MTSAFQPRAGFLVVEEHEADQRRVELGAAPGRQPGQVEFVDPALEDLRGLLGLCHAAAIFISSEKLIFAYRASIEALSKGNLSR